MTEEDPAAFTFSLNRKKLRIVCRREGRDLLRRNLIAKDPALLLQYYIQRIAVEEAFRNLKGGLAIRPIFPEDEKRIEAHILIAFLADCLLVTLGRRLQALAPRPDCPQCAEAERGYKPRHTGCSLRTFDVSRETS